MNPNKISDSRDVWNDQELVAASVGKSPHDRGAIESGVPWYGIRYRRLWRKETYQVAVALVAEG